MAATDLWVGDVAAMVSPSRGVQRWSDAAWGEAEQSRAPLFPSSSSNGALGDFAYNSSNSAAAASSTTPVSQPHTPTPAFQATAVTPPTVTPNSTATKDSICKYFATGGCTRGEFCSYRHDLTIDAATDADASRGFVLMGQVVNLKQSASAAPKFQQRNIPSTLTSPHHSMNPDARPFVSIGGSDDAIAEAESQFAAAAAAYHHNSRLPMLPYSAAMNNDSGTLDAGQYYHASAAAAAYGGEGYHEQQYSHHEGQQYYDSGAAYMEHEAMYSGNSTTAAGDFGGHYPPHGGYSYNNSASASESSAKWRPTGVFSTTAETAAAKSVLAGYYDHALLNKEAMYQHRRSQALRPPLQSTKGPNVSSSSLSSEEGRPQQQTTAAVPTTWTYYPRPSSMDTVHHSYQSADTHRKLRNRPEF